MTNSWFRMYAEFATDPKVQMMSEAFQRRFIMLLCIRCGNDHVTLQDEEVAFQLRISNEEWAATKAVFLAKNLINEDNTPTAWDRRQFRSDSSAERVAKHRAKKKEQVAQPCNVTVTPPDTEADTDISSTDVEDKKRARRFDAVAHLVALGVEESTATDWLTLRKAKKAAPTATAIAGIQREAAKARLTLSQALGVCCQRGWAGFNADWVASAGPPAARQSIHDARAETVAKLTGRDRNDRSTTAERDITGESFRVS